MPECNDFPIIGIVLAKSEDRYLLLPLIYLPRPCYKLLSYPYRMPPLPYQT
ncbi:hypothetical protein SAMN05421823_105168 [Catalinimonas alkaloidigena]|uniref:Uncharacterized protein n=1 Tax=Catalinimonas alkaloidigena TaxID=1075417 RepID=A0A1G9J0T4_9BACT|nr:hypothetical protein SAMN05421823_105168 [Catalinimonas alkaloidigena]